MDPEPPPKLPRFRLRHLGWVMYALYLLVFAWLGVSALGRYEEFERNFGVGVLVALAAQLVFIFGAGTKDLLKPVRKRAFVGPVIAALLIFAVLGLGLWAALDELVERNNDRVVAALLVLPLGAWCVWGAVFWVFTSRLPRWTALKRLTAFLLVGSLLELVATVPAHLITSRRPGCFAGFGGMVGVAAGLAVALWCFGPGLALLCFRGRVREARLADGAPPAPPPPKFLQFHLGGLMAFVSCIGAGIGLILFRMDMAADASRDSAASVLGAPALWLTAVLLGLWLWLAVKRLLQWQRQLRDWERNLPPTGD